MIVCPFCQQDDFDLIGLKIHLASGHCDEYEKIELVAGPFGLESQAEFEEMLKIRRK